MRKSRSLVGLLVMSASIPIGWNIQGAFAAGVSGAALTQNLNVNIDAQGEDEHVRRALGLLELADSQGFHPPVAADQFNQQTKLTALDGEAQDKFGYSLALSGDGNTAIVGAFYADVGGNENQGAVYVFVRSGKNWSQQGTLIALDGCADDWFGWPVALSSDGNTAIVGVKNADVGGENNQGAAYVFIRSGTDWSQQVKLLASDGAASDYFGCSVALNEDGNTAIVGADYADVGGNTNQGAAYAFTRSGASWHQEAKLTASDGAAGDNFGGSVTLAANGNTAIIGARLDDVGGRTNQGSAYAFSRAGTSWRQEAKLTASDGVAGEYFGCSVVLSADGNNTMVGVSYADVGGNTNQGAAYVFTRSGSFWSQQAKLTASDGVMNDYFGHSVAMSADGNTLIASASCAGVGGHAVQGAVYIFTRTGTSWSQQTKLTASDGADHDYLGWSVAMSVDGNTVIAGASYADVGGNEDQGAAYVFAVGKIQFAASEYNVREDAGSVTVTVVRTNDSSGAASVNYATVDGTAVVGTDYTAATGTLTWADGEMSAKTFDVQIVNRAGPQAGRAFTVALSGATGASLGSPATAMVAIADSGTPMAPTGVSASDGDYIDSVLVNWHAAADATGYQIWRGIENNSGAAGLVGASSGTSYSDLNAVAGTSYYYWVKATNASGASAFSALDSGHAMPAGPVIRANGATGTVAVIYPAPVTMAVALNADVYAGVGADWWAVAHAHSGDWYYLNSALAWTRFNGDLGSCRPAYQGALFDLPWTVVLDGYQLSVGTYDFWFAVDYPMDGILNPAGRILLDQVSVEVE